MTTFIIKKAWTQCSGFFMFINYITNYSVNAGDYVVSNWQKLGQFLLVKYLDGNVKKEKDHWEMEREIRRVGKKDREKASLEKKCGYI